MAVSKKVVPLHSQKQTNDQVAQPVEHIPFKDGVLGSSPSLVTEADLTIGFFVFIYSSSYLCKKILNVMKKICILTLLLSLFCFQKTFSQSATIDVLHYNINLNINNLENNKHIGFTEIDFLILSNNHSFVEFDLRNQIVDSVILNNNSIDFSYQNNKIRFDIPNSYSNQDTLVAKIYYSGGNNVEPYNWGGIHYSNSIIYSLGVAFSDYPHCYGRSWFVCKDDFIDKATFDLHITTNKNVKAICSGNLINIDDSNPNNTTYHWKVEQNIPTYTVGLTIANFSKLERNIISNNREIPLNVFYFSNDSIAIAENFKHIDSAFVRLEECFGEFKFNRVGYCTTPLGSMEHVDNISLAHSLASNYSLNAQAVIVHELGHSWFGNLMTCSSAGDMWINEGWTTFTERLSLDAIFGKDVAKKHFRKKIEDVILQLPFEEGRFPLSGVDSTMTYSSTVYDKGALVAMSLKTYIGDSLFYSAVKRLLNDFSFSNISSATLRDSLSSYTGIDLTDFFNYYVFDTTLHHFSIKKAVFGNNSAEITITSRSQFNDNLPCSNIRIPITFMDSAFNRYEQLIIDNGNEQPHHFSLPFTPQAAFLDLEEEFFDLTTDSYKIISEPGNYDFENSYFKAQVNSCEDSIFIRPTLHWVGGKENETLEGISRFSQKHYWSIEGINLEQADITAKFYFKVSYYENNFDYSLLSSFSAKDSLILLYRENPESQWYRIEANIPSSSSGYVTTKLRKGDYIMAIADKNVVGLENTKQELKKIKLHPNPSSGTINITHPLFEEKTTLRIYDNLGKEIFNQELKENTSLTTINLSIPKGYYSMEIESRNEKYSDKIIIK